MVHCTVFSKNKLSLLAGRIGSWYAVADVQLYHNIIVRLDQTFHNVLDP